VANNTIPVAEAAEGGPGTGPEDLACDPAKPFARLGGPFPAGFKVVLSDGDALFVAEKVSAPTLHHAIQCADGEPLGEDFFDGAF
jgi:hypothetical protein